MRIPDDLTQRDTLYKETIRKCAVSRNDRIAFYRMMKRWFLTGSGKLERARFNKLRPHADMLTSYLYSQDTTRFACMLPPHLIRPWVEHLQVVRDEFAYLWHESDSDKQFGEALDWSIPYGATLLKILASPTPRIRYLHPGQFGVIQEDCPDLDDQEAMVHWFVIGESQLRRQLGQGARGQAIFQALQTTATPGPSTPPEESMPPGMGAVVLSQTTPTIQGNVVIGALHGVPEARVDEPTSELAELWFWVDDAMDYRCITFSEAIGQVLWERKGKDLVEFGEHPFILVAPYGDPEYLWGFSEMENLLSLQAWRDTRMGQIDRLLAKQLKRTLSFSNWPGITEEKAEAMRQSGLLTNSSPMAKVEDITAPMPPDAFAEIKEIDRMFGEAEGLPSVLQGEGDPSARAGNQVGAMAKFAGTRTRKRAAVTQDILEEAATKFLRVFRRVDDTVYVVPGAQGQPDQEFLLSQLPATLTMKVAAHSSTPLLAEETQSKAERLNKAHAIDLETYVEMVDPPMADSLRLKDRAIQHAQAEAAKEKFDKTMKIQELKATKRGR